MGEGSFGEGVAAVVGDTDGFVDASLAGVGAGRVGLIENGQGGEILPGETRLVCGARGDVRGEEGPSPGLRDADFEPDRHREETVELAEDHLLASFGGDRLEEELSGLTAVEVVDEAVDSRFAEAGELLAKIDEFSHSCVWVVVRALDGSSLQAQNVGK